MRVFLASGEERYTDFPGGANLGTDHYSFRLLRVGDVVRDISTPPGRFRTSPMSLTLYNGDRHFTKDGPYPSDSSVLGKRVSLTVGPVGGTFATQFYGIYEGIIRDLAPSSDGTVEMTLDESIFPTLNADIEGVITPEEFPYMSSNISSPWKNRIFGNATLVTEQTGMVPFPLIDTRNGLWRVYIANHACKAVDQVYDPGAIGGDQSPGPGGLLTPGVHYTIVEQTVGGKTQTFADFTYFPSGERVVGNVRGITDNGLSSGNLLEEPTDCIRALLLLGGLQSGEIDTVTKAEVAAKMNTQGEKMVYVIDSQISYATALERMLISFTIESWLKIQPASEAFAVKFAFSYPLLAEITGSTPRYDSYDLTRASFREIAPGELATVYTYRYDWRPSQNNFRETKTFRDVTTISQLARPGFTGEIPGTALEFFANRDAASVLRAVTQRQIYQRPANRRVECELLVSDLGLSGGGLPVEPGRDIVVSSEWYTKQSEAETATEPVRVTNVRYRLNDDLVSVRATIYALALASMLWLGPGTLPPYVDASPREKLLYAYLDVGKIFQR